MTAKPEMKSALECTLKVKVGEYGVVCLPSNPSTGYHWVLPAMPECINLTSSGWFAAIPVPHPGAPGFQYFVFRGVTKTATPAKMTFSLLTPAGQPVQNAICTVTVTA